MRPVSHHIPRRLGVPTAPARLARILLAAGCPAYPAAPARPQPRPRPAHRRRSLAVGGLHPARTADRVRPHLQSSRGRRRVSIRFPSLCSIEKRPSLGPDLPPGRAPRGAAVRDAAANAAAPAKPAQSVLDRASTVLRLSWRHYTTTVSRRVIALLFSLDNWWEVRSLRDCVKFSVSCGRVFPELPISATERRPESNAHHPRLAESGYTLPVRPRRGSGPGSRPAATSASRPR